MKLGQILKGSLGTIAAVGVPMFGGKLASDVAKAFAPSVVGQLPNPIVDAIGGAVAAAVTVGGAAVLGGKGAAGRAIPFAVAGAVMGVALPYWDTVIDTATKAAGGASAASAGASSPALPAGQTQAKPGGFRVLPGGNTGATLPGGDVGSTLPGGREGVSSVRAFATSPGGAIY